MQPPPRLLAALVCLLLGACAGDGLQLPSPSPSPPALAVISVSTPTAAPATAAPTVAPTVVPTETATPVPPTPLPSLELRPPQVVQGGIVLVVLNEPATAATASFGGRQYPLLRSGDAWWTIIGVGALVEPGLHPIEVSLVSPDDGGTTGFVVSLAVVDVDFPVENIQLDEETSALLDQEIVQEELARRAVVFSGFTAERLWSGAFLPPAVGPVSSVFGEQRSYNGGPPSGSHSGTDFIGDEGDPVYAAAAGRVVFADELRIRGNAVIVDHGAGVFTAYHHLSEIGVAVGDEVVAGQRLGAIGSTGLVTGPHLHWEVVVRGVEVDGSHWLQGGEIGP